MYNINSSKDGGTLVQLRNLTRRNLPQNPKNDVNATDDFMDLICKGHILAAAMTILGIKGPEDMPSSLPAALSYKSSSQKQAILESITQQVVEKFVNVDPFRSSGLGSNDIDGVYEYAREVLSLCLLHTEFQDAIREGDGLRVLRVWKFLLLVFKASHKVNYSIEAFNLLAQFYILLPPRLGQQLIWSRHTWSTWQKYSM